MAQLQSNTSTKDKPYRLVLGFEVENPKAFSGEIHDLGIDYGHAFFYISDARGYVVSVFSYGPARDVADVTDKIFGVPALTNYLIKDPSKLFPFQISETQYLTIKNVIAGFDARVRSGDAKYITITNETCAATAMTVLASVTKSLGLPEGKSRVRLPGSLINPGYALKKIAILGGLPAVLASSSYTGTTAFGATNPYALYNQMVQKGFKSVRYSVVKWAPSLGMVDPTIIFSIHQPELLNTVPFSR